MKQVLQIIGSLAVGVASDLFLPGIPTVPYVRSDGGSYSLGNVDKIVVDAQYASSVDGAGLTLIPPTLFEFGRLFAEDLSAALGVHVDVVNGTLGSASGIFFTLGLSNDYVDVAGRTTSEGYAINVTSAGISITGASPLGVWWGTRTLLQQALLSESDSSPSVPLGSGTDMPSFPTRGMMLDAGRHYYPPDFLVELCAYMSFFKQNTLHLHLSDNLYNNANYTREQSLELYSRFRLWSDDSAVAGLNLYRNESYDRETFEQVQSSCAARGVTVLPEIEAPGHALVITQWKPELGLSSDLSLLNISHPDTIPTMKTIWGTFLPWFKCKVVSIGADEYTGPEAEYNEFVNAMSSFIGSGGQSTRIWGTFPPIYNSTWTNVYQNVSVQHWEYFEDDPYFDYIMNNYSVVNSNDNFYIVNKWAPPGGYLNTINLTKTFHGSPDGGYWRPNIFDQRNATENPSEFNPFVLGSIVPLWNDYGANASVYSEAYYAWREGIPALADKQWGGNVSDATFHDIFNNLLAGIPGQNLDRSIETVSDVIFSYKVESPSAYTASTLELADSSPNKYTAKTNCPTIAAETVNASASPALAVSPSCSITTPLDSKGRNYTLSLSMRVDELLGDGTNVTLVTGRDSMLMLTPNITLFAGGNHFRLNSTVPLGSWFDLLIIGRGNRTFARLDDGEEMQFLTRMGINGIYFHWAEIAIEAPLTQLGGPGSQWSGAFRGMSLRSVA